MKNLKKYIPILLILLSNIFICATCKENEYKDVIYYSIIGKGYVFMCDSIGCHPKQGANVILTTCNGTGGLFGVSHPVTETYITDAKGYYQVRFIKSVPGGTFVPGTKVFYTNSYHFECENQYFTLSVEDVKNAQNNTVVLDTIKLYINEIEY